MKTMDNVEYVARAAHEVNRVYCQTIGDHSQVSWHDAPEWQKESARSGVCFVLNNPDAGPSASHDSWLEEKHANGWKYGAVKDDVKKEHPCFVAYEHLPENQKAKDLIFVHVVKELMAWLP